MSNALIIYGSTTGNTEDMANSIKELLDEIGLNTEIKNVADAVAADLTANHDLLLLGCPAYGDDSIELQDDFSDFYEQLSGINLNNKKFAVFAPGDSSYEYFCGSVDFLEEKMKEIGGQMLVDGLKIDGDPADAGDEIAQWSRAIADSLN